MSNSAHMVNRIGLLRRRLVLAWCVVMVVSCVAVVGWCKALAPITDLQILKALNGKIHMLTDCEEYAETMCNYQGDK